ncbi:MAG: HAMP domain-containing histidine kinase [Megasphaera sp.]|jgi:signal transduction histidine kinase|nr:HAMP domain-containing histidine kinase [Megasphaera sp.]MCH4187447.1 HAMP domain-containing histidine kinase [Megasphaera sp.]MCH4217366.1 HAMP domain-containing histidine kinase [Megasphaera sp.]
MSKSIRTKVSIYAAGFMLIFIVALMAAVGLGFTKYFYEVKKSSMIESSQVITRIYQEEGLDGEDQMDQISRNLGADVLIVDNSQLVYSSRPGGRVNIGRPEVHEGDVVVAVGKEKEQQSPPEQMRPPKHIREMIDLIQGGQPDESEIGQVRYYKPDPNFQYFYLINRIAEHTYLLIMRPMAPMKESVDIFQKFIFTVGAIWIVFALLGALYFSRKITKPMLELRKQSAAMTRLDFSKRWNHPWDDEIGQLGNSLNTLSDQLSTALADLQKSNAQLKEQLDKAKEVEHMRKSFISAVSHELKTPLALIQGYAEGLDSLKADEERRHQYCRIINSETEKMDKLVKDLLNLSRLETGSFRIAQTAFDFCALADEAKERFANVIGTQHIDMRWELPDEMTVYGDPERYDTILSNFLSNAIDYTDAGKRIVVRAEDMGDAYKICIYNQGVQIAPEFQKRIWEPFYKIDMSRARNQRIFGGHGLGLGIVAALVKLHHQTCGVYNNPDGVTFWVTIAKPKP